MRPIPAAILGFLLGIALVLIVTAGGKAPAAPPRPAPPTLIPPLHDAEVGEWVRLASGRDAILYRVVEATDFDVTVETITYHDEEPGPPQSGVLPRNGFGMPPNGVVRAIARDRIQVGGRPYDCWRFDVFAHEGQYAYWLTDEVPATGWIKYARVDKGTVNEATAATLVGSGKEP